ncbi:MAG: sigma 54-interacting transcriptional regulator [Deltaproteobacteria bacterium]|nr:sigma 54-interacting transcriptional regulator [Deltaproteobacteria bacterium]
MAETEPNLWRLTLSARTGPDAGKTCVVERDIITVGKFSDCDLVLSDSTVSRRHLRIARTKDPTTGEVRWVLSDLGSTNGTFLGETRVQEAPIEAGAVLKAGKVELAFTPERQAFAVPEWPEPRFGPLIGKSRPMRELFGMLARIAPTEATVLIQGDTGTGKGLVAKAIHQASARASKAYMVVDCGAVQRQLIESELFGHEKGAFTGAYQRRQGAFELCSGGTIFIDELGELELDLQPKLLRVLDAREVRRIGAAQPTPVDLRVIAASRRTLHREVERGAFREDLYFRLSVVNLTIPPLKDRAEDIPLLVEHFLEEVCRTRNLTPPRISSATMDRLTSHDWPGNVRELKNSIERAVLLSAVKAGDKLEIGAFAPRVDGAPKSPGPTSTDSFDPSLSFSESKERFVDARERAYVTWLLAGHDGNISAAARAAQMDRKYLHKLLKKHGLEDQA